VSNESKEASEQKETPMNKKEKMKNQFSSIPLSMLTPEV